MSNVRFLKASSNDMDAPAQTENAGDDDGDYLEIMVSEKDFDDVGRSKERLSAAAIRVSLVFSRWKDRFRLR